MRPAKAVGKVRSSYNALRHGLAAKVRCQPASAATVCLFVLSSPKICQHYAPLPAPWSLEDIGVAFKVCDSTDSRVPLPNLRRVQPNNSKAAGHA